MNPGDKDLEAWEKWHASQSPMDLQELITKLNPLIQSEVNRRAGTLARPMLVTQARVLAVKAIKSFDPARGVKLSTHVTNQLQKLSRVNYAHQNAARIPEHSMLQFHTYRVAKEDFQTDNGRDPSISELADSLKWSTKKLEQFQTQFERSELLESKETPSDMFVPHNHDPRIDYVYYSLSPQQQRIFEYTTGYLGTPIIKSAAIKTKLGITQGVLSYEKNKIKKAMQAVT